ncbi:MAG: glycosyltransferase family 2 protein [Nitrospina sp.]|jgi:glycosyltransferase involved in cell wall biosynthesis|nr:glycosyltransferase family 2 protein [Nitrospina sp.]
MENKADLSQKCPSFAVVIPVFNEDFQVGESIKQCLVEMETLGVDFEIVAVDDGSADRTYEKLRRISQQDNRVKILQNHINLNVGISLLRGFYMAEKDFVLSNAIDLCYDLKHLNEIMPLLNDTDVLVIERKERGSVGLFRKFVSIANSLLIRLLFQTDIRTYNFVQIYRREWLELAKPKLLSRSPGFAQAELIIRAIKSGARVKTSCSEVRPREMGKSHFGKPHDLMWPLYEMLRFRIRTLRGGF